MRALAAAHDQHNRNLRIETEMFARCFFVRRAEKGGAHGVARDARACSGIGPFRLGIAEQQTRGPRRAKSIGKPQPLVLLVQDCRNAHALRRPDDGQTHITAHAKYRLRLEHPQIEPRPNHAPGQFQRHQDQTRRTPTGPALHWKMTKRHIVFAGNLRLHAAFLAYPLQKQLWIATTQFLNDGGCGRCMAARAASGYHDAHQILRSITMRQTLLETWHLHNHCSGD